MLTHSITVVLSWQERVCKQWSPWWQTVHSLVVVVLGDCYLACLTQKGEFLAYSIPELHLLHRCPLLESDDGRLFLCFVQCVDTWCYVFMCLELFTSLFLLKMAKCFIWLLQVRCIVFHYTLTQCKAPFALYVLFLLYFRFFCCSVKPLCTLDPARQQALKALPSHRDRVREQQEQTGVSWCIETASEWVGDWMCEWMSGWVIEQFSDHVFAWSSCSHSPCW